jgi:hypothetical protein
MGSPAGLDYAGEFSTERKSSKTDTAELEVPVVGVGSAADLASVLVSNRELRRSVQLRKLFCTGHRKSLET